ncbi:methyltransferase, FxLD system [Streptomyces sp. DSM 44917]|uniref:Protein-L-isoaspartate O-methyltransferase n=1 Tax=Streptomyces boetiae TaxID=3075541 RepID=A0ABU2L6Z7_9ACTN|nr:methyltransferase, FxLD system [Streptomyces sp. DSM 44917]MDT0307340.1 methyltransferase, FxLD system [Streptomyces sp. DSM 44917]
MENHPDMTTDDVKPAVPAQQLRDEMVRQLVDMEALRDSRAVAAFQKVPRHLATPEQDVATTYRVEHAVITKTDADGVQLSSVSAPRIQAMQIEQGDIRPGMRVLEIGSGGVNAAYLAEIVGKNGLVVTADIDPEVTGRAEKFLHETGYEGRVRVVTGDGEAGVPEYAPYDRVIVTVQAADVPPAWRDQLVEGGRLVVPLRMRGMTRTVAFVRRGHRLVSDGFELCGFVPMQGVGENRVRLVLLHDVEGEEVGLRLDGHPEPNVEALRAALNAPRVEAWSGVTLAGDESNEHLDLWLTTVFDNLPLLTGTPAARARGLVASVSPHGIPTLVEGASFAYRTVRPTDDPDRFELGAIAHGLHAQAVGDAMVEQIKVWGREQRGNRARIGVYPADTPDDQLPAGRVIDRPHTRIAITWP